MKLGMLSSKVIRKNFPCMLGNSNNTYPVDSVLSCSDLISFWANLTSLSMKVLSVSGTVGLMSAGRREKSQLALFSINVPDLLRLIPLKSDLKQLHLS